MKPIDYQIALAARDAVRAVLPPASARPSCRIDRRGGAGVRRPGRGGGGSRADAANDPLLYGLTGFSSANFLRTATGGGELGVASGFGGVLMFRLNQLPGALSVFRSSLSSAGWQMIINSNNTLSANFHNGGTFTASSTYQLTTSDVGRILVFVARITATPGQQKVYVSKASAADVTQSGYGPSSGIAETLGAYAAGTAPATAALEAIAAIDFRGDPTNAQLDAMLDAARALGDLPTSFDGATVTHRWSVRDELRGVANPAGRKSLGVRGWPTTGASYLATAAGTAAGIVGSASGFFVQARVRLDTTGSFARYLVVRFNGNTGYILEQALTSLQCRMFTGSGVVTSPAYVIQSVDVGRVLIASAVWDQPAQKLRLYIDGIEVGAGTAMTAYAPDVASEPMYVSRWTGGASNDGNYSVFEVAGGNAIPTQAELFAQALASEKAGALVAVPAKTDNLWTLGADIAANGGAMPASFPNRSGADALVRTGTLEVAADVATAPPCPVQLTDRVTGAAADAHARVGTPVVKTIDPAIDGRRVLGAQGFSAGAQLATSGGVRGSTGTFWYHLYGRLDALVAGVFQVLCSTTLSGSDGWQLFLTTTSQLAFNVAPHTATTTAAAFTSADVGRMHQIQMVYDGATLSLYLDRVLVASIAHTGTGSSTQPHKLGGRGDNTLPPTGWSIMGAQGGDGFVPTLAELQAAYDATDAAGRIQAIPGKTLHQWDLTADILASGVDAVPATILDRVGTDHLTRSSVDVAIAGKQGLRLSAAAQMATGVASTAGIQGAAAAVTISLLFSPLTTIQGSSGGHYLAAKFNTATGTVGWCVNRFGASGALSTLTFTFMGGSYGGYAVQNADLGALLHLALTYDGTNVRVYLNGNLVSTNALASAYSNPAAPLTVGYRYGDGTFASNDSAFFGVAGGAYVATQAELAAQATASIAAGQLVAIPGRTDDRRYNFAQDAIDQASTLPARCVDRMGTADAMVRIGSGLTLAQRTERLWSYESSPIMQSASTPTPISGRYESAAGVQNAGDAASFFVAPLVRCVSATNGRFLANSQGGVGWYFNCNSSLITFAFADGVSLKTSGNITATPDGKVRPILGVFDAPSSLLRAYASRAQIGTGVAASGYTLTNLASIGVAMGGFWGGSSGNAGVEILGFAMGYGVPTLAEFREWEDACIALEDIVALGGKKTSHLYSVKRGRTATQLTDLVGTVNLPAVGAGPTVVDIYGRAFAA